MNDEEQAKIAATLTRAVLSEVAFNPENAEALFYMVAHDITPEEVEHGIDGILSYLERTKEAKGPSIGGVKFETPEELLEGVAARGGRVFGSLTRWQRFDREENERVLNEVILHAAERPDDELYEVTYDGLVNVADCTHVFALPMEAELRTGSVEWLEEIDVSDVGERLADLKEVEDR